MLRKLVVMTFSLSVLAACGMYQATAQVVTPEQASLIDATCTKIMGLRKGEYYYNECQESLGRSLAGLTEAQQTLKSYDDCRGQGYAEGSAALSACILDGQKAIQTPTRTASAAPDYAAAVKLAYPGDELQSGESYYNVTPRVHWKREQYSCAQLGLVPGSNAFGHCVAGLDAALLPDMN